MSQIENNELETVKLTEAQTKARKQRAIALALCLAAFVLLLYFLTWFKFGPEILVRPM